MPEPSRDTKEATVIGGDTHIKGEMTFKKGARLLGVFEGKISGDGELHIAENANCKADIETVTALVDGTIEGNLLARDKVQLNAKGVVKGDIVAAKMVMTEGATFFGQCSIGPEAVKGAAKPATPAGAPHVTPHGAPPPRPAGRPNEMAAT
jgi:cytoskeletal protein CcmA (bactofilin family)